MDNRRPPRNHSSQNRQYTRSNDRPTSKDRVSGADAGRRSDRQPGSGTDARGRDGRRTGFRPADDRGPAYPRPARDFRSGPSSRRGPGQLGPGDRGRRRPDTAKKHKEPPAIPITSDSQITDGKFRGTHLLNSTSPRTAPTARKLREVMFKIISRRVKSGRFLDLGAGSGTIGLEAISRGAMLASFVERSDKMCSFLRKNLEALGIKNGHSEVYELEIQPFLKRAAERKRCWDLVYFGAGAYDGDAPDFKLLNKGTIIEPGGLLMIEHSASQEMPDKLGSLVRWRVIANGDARISFYERK